MQTLSPETIDQLFVSMLHGHAWPWKPNHFHHNEVMDDRAQVVIRCDSDAQASEIITYADHLRTRLAQPSGPENLGLLEGLTT
jgi:hypothetical protein